MTVTCPRTTQTALEGKAPGPHPHRDQALSLDTQRRREEKRRGGEIIKQIILQPFLIIIIIHYTPLEGCVLCQSYCCSGGSMCEYALDLQCRLINLFTLFDVKCNSDILM